MLHPSPMHVSRAAAQALSEVATKQLTTSGAVAHASTCLLVTSPACPHYRLAWWARNVQCSNAYHHCGFGGVLEDQSQRLRNLGTTGRWSQCVRQTNAMRVIRSSRRVSCKLRIIHRLLILDIGQHREGCLRRTWRAREVDPKDLRSPPFRYHLLAVLPARGCHSRS